MKSNHLILFTASFPFENGEPFLETEIRYLSERFEKITIVSQANSKKNLRSLPGNVEVRTISTELSKVEQVLSLTGRFSKIYRDEKRYIKEVLGLKLNSQIFKTFAVSLAKARKVEKFIEQLYTEFKGDNIAFYSYWSDDLAIGLALFKFKNRDVRCFSRVHGWDVYFEASEIGYLPMRKYLSENLDAIFPISETGKNYCLNRWKVADPSRIKVSRLGVGEQSFSGNYKNPFTIVSCANMIPLKRIHLLIDALVFLEVETKIRWVHFGSGSLEQELKQRASDKISSRIEVEFAGQVSNSELMDWYAENRPALFVNTSSTEGIPVSIMEAMSFGTPVIATDVGGTSEIVTNDNGILVSADFRVEELKEELMRMIHLDRAQMEKYRLAAVSTWSTKFNASANYNQFVDEIQDL